MGRLINHSRLRANVFPKRVMVNKVDSALGFPDVCVSRSRESHSLRAKTWKQARSSCTTMETRRKRA
jgi:hypothetical protein